MKLQALLDNIQVEGEIPALDVTGLTADSRKVQKGGCFVAIAGTRIDGHDYVPQAEAAGAAVIVAQRPVRTALPLLLVQDTREAYARMAGNYYGNPAGGLRLYGVTGTNGKTSSTFILKHVLECEGHRVGLIGTIVNMTGDEVLEADNTTPDAMELQGLFAKMRAAGCDACVMEVSSHAIDQQRIAGLHFACAIFTNLTQDHLDYHGTMEAYHEVKRRLTGLTDIAVFNLDDPEMARMMQASEAPLNCSFSCESDAADITAKNIALHAAGIEYQAVSRQEISRIQVAMPGGFNVYNTLGVLTAAVAVGIPQQRAAEALRSCEGVKGRIEVVPVDVPYTVILDYAHTPDALVNIGRALKDFATGRILTVFGCGGDRDRTKRPKMARAAADFSDYFVLTSDNPRTEDPQRIVDDAYVGVQGTAVPHEVIVDRTEAIRHALAEARAGDIVLIAGKGHETYQVLATGKIHYDEREVVRDILNGKL
ncbi:MAG: UDP-N-acetylmuramoyl-L-alanyl-D-glutamate--2,6-diaminopimelate ligase [Clostridiales bacterium]|nr:UDP-N-acetylmuramoyl-L-alanyl-D-glutamate--2,6-diaminopimelate ligase [Clostridiales bacterium]